MRMAKTKTPSIQLQVMKMISQMFVGRLFFPEQDINVARCSILWPSSGAHDGERQGT